MAPVVSPETSVTTIQRCPASQEQNFNCFLVFRFNISPAKNFADHVDHVVLRYVIVHRAMCGSNMALSYCPLLINVTGILNLKSCNIAAGFACEGLVAKVSLFAFLKCRFLNYVSKRYICKKVSIDGEATVKLGLILEVWAAVC